MLGLNAMPGASVSFCHRPRSCGKGKAGRRESEHAYLEKFIMPLEPLSRGGGSVESRDGSFKSGCCGRFVIVKVTEYRVRIRHPSLTTE